MEIDIHIPEQRRDIEESANGLPDVIEKFIDDVINQIVKICGNMDREALVKPIVRETNRNPRPWSSLDFKNFPLSDNRLIELIADNRLLACIYQRRDDLNFVETTFFLYPPTFTKIEENWKKYNS